jgi:hypothetical protein
VRCLTLLMLLALLEVAVACGSGKGVSTQTGGLTGTPSTPVSQVPVVVPVTPYPAEVSADGKLSVTGGPIGAVARATMKATPGVTCAIVYKHPSGTLSTQNGLDAKPAGADGTVSWDWLISPTTRLTGAKGSVTVTCGADSATAPITVGG